MNIMYKIERAWSKGGRIWCAAALITYHLSLIISFSSCDSYIDITPKGSITVDSAYQYYELIVDPMRGYQPAAFAFLTDELWSKESYIIGYESTFGRSAMKRLSSLLEWDVVQVICRCL